MFHQKITFHVSRRIAVTTLLLAASGAALGFDQAKLDVFNRDANLSGANLSGAKTQGAKLEATKFCKTTMPDGSADDARC